MSMAIRAASAGLPAPSFLRFNSASARWIESAARTARSASFSIAEQRHQSIAELLGDFAAHLCHGLGSSLEISANQIAPFFSVELRRDTGRNPPNRRTSP
jgi:hypothetical protein